MPALRPVAALGGGAALRPKGVRRVHYGQIGAGGRVGGIVGVANAPSSKTGVGGGWGTSGLDILFASLYLANMSEVLEAASGAAKLFLEFSKITIDNWTFKLFYRGTTTFLVTASVMASCKQVFGDPISCEVVKSHETNQFPIGAQLITSKIIFLLPL